MGFCRQEISYILRKANYFLVSFVSSIRTMMTKMLQYFWLWFS